MSPEPAEPATIRALAGAIKRREISARAVVEGYLDRIEKHDEQLHCFHETYPGIALSAAAAIDARLDSGEDPGALAGVPVAVKDNLVTSFGHTTCGSRFLEDFKSPYTCTAVQRLLDAGAIILGKTNCDEFAMGSSTEHCAHAQTHNPWDPARVPGGSSGGSAAAVAAGLCPAALGSDTGGSIRQPAAMCGVVGIKPSYGRVSRWGLVAFGSSLDQVGAIGRTVEDTAVLLGVIAGADPRDSTCTAAEVPDYLAGLDDAPRDLRIGVPRQYLSEDNDPAVNDAIGRAVNLYRALGAEIVDIDLPLTDYGIATYYVIAPAEASSNLARYDGIRYGRRAQLTEGEGLYDLYARSRAEGFGPEVQRRIMLGTFTLSAGYYDAYYKRALQVRRLIKQEMDRAFAQCHVLLGPTAPTPAFALGEKVDPLSMYLCDVYTTAANIAGTCGLSLPCGHAEADGRRLPIGLQLQAAAFDEATLLGVARMFEANTKYSATRPSLTSTSR
jgi:aspartyl-tRNA(Asn)/glutamyl-tRNA(Gln) amidotransferase subunit A